MWPPCTSRHNDHRSTTLRNTFPCIASVMLAAVALICCFSCWMLFIFTWYTSDFINLQANVLHTVVSGIPSSLLSLLVDAEGLRVIATCTFSMDSSQFRNSSKWASRYASKERFHNYWNRKTKYPLWNNKRVIESIFKAKYYNLILLKNLIGRTSRQNYNQSQIFLENHQLLCLDSSQVTTAWVDICSKFD